MASLWAFEGVTDQGGLARSTFWGKKDGCVEIVHSCFQKMLCISNSAERNVAGLPGLTRLVRLGLQLGPSSADAFPLGNSLKDSFGDAGDAHHMFLTGDSQSRAENPFKTRRSNVKQMMLGDCLHVCI